jgi:hypothetical protein
MERGALKNGRDRVQVAQFYIDNRAEAQSVRGCVTDQHLYTGDLGPCLVPESELRIPLIASETAFRGLMGQHAYLLKASIQICVAHSTLTGVARQWCNERRMVIAH